MSYTITWLKMLRCSKRLSKCLQSLCPTKFQIVRWTNLELRMSKSRLTPLHSTDFSWLRLLPSTSAHPIGSLIYRALERLEPGLSPPGVEASANWATGQVSGFLASLGRVLESHLNNLFCFVTSYLQCHNGVTKGAKENLQNKPITYYFMLVLM